MRTYRVARMDLVVGFATAYFSLLLTFFAAYGALRSEWKWLLVSALMLVALWLSWQYSPKRYDLSECALVIIRGWPFPDISIPFEQIATVERSNWPMWTFSRRYGGTWLFSNSGWSWGVRMGEYYLSFTDSRRTVLISADKSYLISPEDPDQFVSDMESYTDGIRRQRT